MSSFVSLEGENAAFLLPLARLFIVRAANNEIDILYIILCFSLFFCFLFCLCCVFTKYGRGQTLSQLLCNKKKSTRSSASRVPDPSPLRPISLSLAVAVFHAGGIGCNRHRLGCVCRTAVCPGEHAALRPSQIGGARPAVDDAVAPEEGGECCHSTVNRYEWFCQKSDKETEPSYRTKRMRNGGQ